MLDHNSTAIIHLCTLIKSESLQEKMTLAPTFSSSAPPKETEDDNMII